MSNTPMTAAELDEMLKPPTDAEVAAAVAQFAAAVRGHYGKRLKGLYMFGSRARGDHEPDSDVDVAVVLAEDEWDFWREKMALADLAYDSTADTGVYVQGWPLTVTAWNEPDTHRNPSLVRAMRRDGKMIDDAAS